MTAHFTPDDVEALNALGVSNVLPALRRGGVDVIDIIEENGVWAVYRNCIIVRSRLSGVAAFVTHAAYQMEGWIAEG